jgi:hypothetical protein
VTAGSLARFLGTLCFGLVLGVLLTSGAHAVALLLCGGGGALMLATCCAAASE